MTIRRSALIAAGIALLILASINWWMRPDNSIKLSTTSFGVGPYGYKAAFDLADELRMPLARNYRRVGLVPVNTVMLLAAPDLLDRYASDDDVRALLEWIRRGGSAIVLGDHDSLWERLALPEVSKGDDHGEIKGNLARTARAIEVPGLLHFDSAPHDSTIELTADNAPFAIRRKLGKGELIAIADDRFMTNYRLGDGDNSLLFVDLMLRLRPTLFDEHSHGLFETSSFFAMLAKSRALLPIVLGLLCAIIWMVGARPWPRRTPSAESELPAPSIGPFVESLGLLYARAADPAATFSAYREGFILRLRRATRLGEIDPAMVLERISADRSITDETRRWLLEPPTPANDAELVRAVRALEAYPRSTNG